jgi:uncharacterized glyoxalase superfamily protein PhnB
MKNRSVPTDAILPHLVYQDVSRAIDWLTAVFGFVEHYHYGDPAQGAQMQMGGAWIMLRSARAGSASPSQAGLWTQSLTVFPEDVDAHFARSKSAGAKIVEDLKRLCTAKGSTA